MNRHTNAHAFTLLELLVVMGVIALLAGLLAPALARGRTAVGMASCQSNLHQLGLGILMYAEDNDDALPTRSSRLESWMARHVDSVRYGQFIHGLPINTLCVLPSVLVPDYLCYDPFVCPGKGRDSLPIPGVPSYFYHPAIVECPLALRYVDRPSDLILVHDHPFPTDRHAGSGCGVFADGHTEIGRSDSGQRYSLAWRRFLAGSPCADWRPLSSSR